MEGRKYLRKKDQILYDFQELKVGESITFNSPRATMYYYSGMFNKSNKTHKIKLEKVTESITRCLKVKQSSNASEITELFDKLKEGEIIKLPTPTCYDVRYIAHWYGKKLKDHRITISERPDGFYAQKIKR